ncbi:AAA family ATPase [Dactylosporangium sp. NPDC049742]|uniref:AAA family ATPase n=1 Tax=Dactylosporangium sp. NPDC049742 TaxID=3154737 RepID=UPI0034198EF2
MSTFVGRDRELAALTGAFAAGGVVLVDGPAGIGKTTLVDRALRQAGATAVRGYCPAEPAPPLWPWRAVLPGAVSPDLGAPFEPTAAASARFAALARLSDAVLAGGSPLILLEDLHWADVASLDLLRHVAQGATAAGVTVVGTVRSPSPDAVALRLADLARYGAVRVPLSPFTLDEVARLVDAASAPSVLARTGGLPLLVAAVGAGSEPGDLPAVVRTLLATLSPQERAAVEAAAVLGEEVDDSLLAVVAGTPVGGFLTAARHAGLLVVAPPEHRYRFAHALVRDTIVAGLEPAALRELARSAAVALESASGSPAAAGGRGTVPAARIAALWRQAGVPDAAAAWSRRAAAQARAAHAYDDAAAHLSAASTVELPPAERAELLVELAQAEYLAGRYDRCLDHCVDAAGAAAEAGRGDLVAAGALVLQGVTYAHAGSVVTRLCQRALAYPDLGDGLRARVLAQLAVMTADAGQVGQAAAPARESLALASACGDPHAEIEAARAREMTLVDPADTPERLRLGDLVADQAEALGQPLAALIGHEWRMQCGYLTGRLDVVESAAAAIEDLAGRSPLPVLQWHRNRMLASRATLAGRFDDAVAHSRHATAIALASGDPSATVMHFAHGVHVAVLRGDPAALPEGLDAAFAAAPLDPLIDVQRANVALLTGALTDAREVYDRLRAQLPLPADHPAWPAVLTQLTGLIEHFADAEAAAIVHRQLLPFRPYPGALGTATVFFHGTVSRFLGQLAAVAGDTTGAVELLREALTRNRAIGARADLALTGLALARVLPAGPEATALARDAADLASRLGMPGPAAAAGGNTSADPLTAREREIAGLLAEALTNRQIAARLVLSERTIESHVRSILAKTQCTNRTEFVARWPAHHSPGRRP